MSFMKPYVYRNMYGWMIETTHGTEYLPGDVVSVPKACTIGQRFGADSDIAAQLRDYCEGEIQCIEVVKGCFGRYSAPGYMDCTEWDFDTDADALAARLDEMYGDDDEESDEEE